MAPEAQAAADPVEVAAVMQVAAPEETKEAAVDREVGESRTKVLHLYLHRNRYRDNRIVPLSAVERNTRSTGPKNTADSLIRMRFRTAETETHQ